MLFCLHKRRRSRLRLFFCLSLLILCPLFNSLFLLRKRKARDSRKAGGEAFESLQAKLRDRAETLNLSLEQKTKGMKQRDKKVACTKQQKLNFLHDLRTLLISRLISKPDYIAYITLQMNQYNSILFTVVFMYVKEHLWYCGSE